MAEAAQIHLPEHRGECRARARSMKTVRSGKDTAHGARKHRGDGGVTPCPPPPMECTWPILPGIAPGPALFTNAGALAAKIPGTSAANPPNRHGDAVFNGSLPTENGDFHPVYSVPPLDPPQKHAGAGNQTTTTLHRCWSAHQVTQSIPSREPEDARFSVLALGLRPTASASIAPAGQKQTRH